MGQCVTQRILLCGFMGCGKTSVGQALAFRLKWDFLDTDAIIEKKEGMLIPQIFLEKGETYFRQAEAEAASQIARRKNIVISTGGGFLMHKKTCEALSQDESTSVIFLDCDFDTCYFRIKNSSRPLVVGNTPEALKEIFDHRSIIYRNVSTTQVGNSGLISEAVDEILKKIVVL